MMIICPATGLECKSSGCTSGLRSCDHWPKAIPTNDRYSDGFKAGREAGMREASEIANRHGVGVITRELARDICDAILSAIGDK